MYIKCRKVEKSNRLVVDWQPIRNAVSEEKTTERNKQRVDHHPHYCTLLAVVTMQ